MFLPFYTNLLCMYVCSVAVEYTTYKPCCQVNYEKILNFTSERYSHSLTLSCMRLDFSSQTAYNRVANENNGVHSYHQEQQENPYGTVHTEGVFCSLGVSATTFAATDSANESIVFIYITSSPILWSRMADFCRIPQVSPFRNGSNMQKEPLCIRTAALAVFRYFILRIRRHGSRG